MDSKTFQIVDFSIAGVMEQHKDFIVNGTALNLLKQCCTTVDDLMETRPYDLHTSISDDADDCVSGTIALFDPDSGVSVCSFTVNRLFIKGGT